MNAQRPRVFIGSSTEGSPIAEAFQVALDEQCEVEVWNQGTFGLSQGTLDALVRALNRFDFAILVATADDMREMRGDRSAVPRDNVLFELGLFMGRLGPLRTFLTFDRSRRPQLPSDLAGVTLADYALHSTGNVQASIGAAATKIRRAIADAGTRQSDLHERLDDVHKSVIAAGEIGPGEQVYFDKLSQLLELAPRDQLTLIYADIDGLRSVTRRIFQHEKEQRDVAGRRLGRRPESEIRAEFLLALNISLTDAVYAFRPRGLKHDIFELPDPDAVMIGRDLAYDDGLEVARLAQAAFREEFARLVPEPDRTQPGVTLLVAGIAHARSLAGSDEPVELHQFLRRQLKALKDDAGRGRVFGHDALRAAVAR